MPAMKTGALTVPVKPAAAGETGGSAITEHGTQLFLLDPDGHSIDVPVLTRPAAVPPSDIANLVARFHTAFRLPQQKVPNVDAVSRDLLQLRTALLDEETAEFADAAARQDLIGMADALADVVYVSYGTAITLGIDLDAVLREVHRSNMSKLDELGRPVLRDDGKVLKSPRYTRPDVGRVLDEQLPLPY